MDLGIAGRKAIVCASSRGLGRACAKALAEAGCEVVINGRDRDRLAETAAELRKTAGGKIVPVVADVASPEGQKALFAACPEPDILVNNNAGPPFRDFRELDRQKMIDGVIANMIVGDRADPEGDRPDDGQEIRPHRQHHLRLGEDAARRARPFLRRARRPDRVSGRRRPLGRRRQRHHQFRAARRVRDRPVARPLRDATREEARHQPPKPCSPNASAACRRGGSASPTNSARPARSCARPMPATSPARTCSWTAGLSRRA